MFHDRCSYSTAGNAEIQQSASD